MNDDKPGGKEQDNQPGAAKPVTGGAGAGATVRPPVPKAPGLQPPQPKPPFGMPVMQPPPRNPGAAIKPATPPDETGPDDKK